MRILLTRTRIGAEAPSYSYRVHIPFTDISLERQALIAMHSDYGGYPKRLHCRTF